MSKAGPTLLPMASDPINADQPLEAEQSEGHPLADELYRTTIYGQWGMLNPEETGTHCACACALCICICIWRQ